MSWIFRADNGKYLESFRQGCCPDDPPLREVKWTEFQMWAYRFENRNAASAITKVCGEPGVIKTLVSKHELASRRTTERLRATSEETQRGIDALRKKLEGWGSPTSCEPNEET